MVRVVFKPENFWKKRAIKELKRKHQRRNKKQDFLVAGGVWDA